MTQRLTLSFDPTPYVRSPVVNIASGISLGQALLAIPAAGFAVPLKKTRARLKQAVEGAQTAWADKQRHSGSGQALTFEEKRAIDLSADRGWGALRMRLEAYGLLPEDRPKARKARRLLQSLFTEGTEFLKWRFAEQFAAMDTLLKRIDEERLAADLDDVCGPEFLAHLRELHPIYRNMLHKRPAAVLEAELNLGDQVRDLAAAIADYALKVSAQVEPDDNETIILARTLLAPIDELREAQSRSEAAKPEAPDAPTPAPNP